MYHDTFRRIDLPGEQCADAISFIELIDVPTTNIISDEGFDQLLQDSLGNGHIMRLQNSILNAENKLVFMPDEVIRNLKKINEQHGLFPGLKYAHVRAEGLPIIYENPDRNVTVRKYIHLSAHQFHYKRVLAQLPIIRELVLTFLTGSLENSERLGIRSAGRSVPGWTLLKSLQACNSPKTGCNTGEA